MEKIDMKGVMQGQVGFFNQLFPLGWKWNTSCR